MRLYAMVIISKRRFSVVNTEPVLVCIDSEINLFSFAIIHNSHEDLKRFAPLFTIAIKITFSFVMHTLSCVRVVLNSKSHSKFSSRNQRF